MGKPGFPIPPSRESVGAGHTRTQGDGGNRVSPFPHPAGGVGRAIHSRREMGETGFPHSPTRREGVEGWPLHIEMAKPGFPVPPPGGRMWAGYALAQGNGGNRVSPFPAPAGGVGRATHSRREMGETGFPHSPPRREGLGGPHTHAGRWGKLGFPIPPPGGRVWAGHAFSQGDGETGFPHPPTRWEGVRGLRPRAGVWENRVAPSSHLAGAWARAAPSHRGVGKPGCPTTHPEGGCGRAQPSQEQPFSSHWDAAQPHCRLTQGERLPGRCGMILCATESKEDPVNGNAQRHRGS